MTALAIVSLLLAAGPAILFARNLRVFSPPEIQSGSADDVAILIPARNEAHNIAAAVDAALANEGAEVFVLDDDSTDSTREIVAERAARSSRLHLIEGKPLPPGWCGKNWACSQLAEAATGQLLIFVDADVRLAPNAATSLRVWLARSGAQLASGLPRQELGSFSERLLIPLIHFVLLGFLPLRRMRQSRHSAYATGCGQLVIAEAEAYRKAFGHAAIGSKIHDGLALPKTFREAGFQTDLFDATELATCRMYRSDAETWRGLSKNTHEGLGAPLRILPVTLLLVGGQVLPFVLLLVSPLLTSLQFLCALTAATLVVLTRLKAARRFHQPIPASFFHPLSILALCGIQWFGLWRYLRRSGVNWKGRSYVRVSESPREAGVLPGDSMAENLTQIVLD